MTRLKLRILLTFCLTLTVLPAFAADSGHWIGTWGDSPNLFRPFGAAPPPEPLENQTVRQKLRISAGGNRVMIRFSNEMGVEPLVIGAATVARAGEGATIVPASLRSVTFGGQTSITVPPGAPALSDPIDMGVEDLEELAVSIYLPNMTPIATQHGGRTSYIGTDGDTTDAADMADAKLSIRHVFLTGVYVQTRGNVKVIAAFGDSITDGTASTPHTYNSWPDQFAARVDGDIAVVNHGIAGNQVLADGAGVSALARFDRDVLSIPGLTHIILLEGINDIGTGGLNFNGGNGPAPPMRTAADIIAGYRQLIARAHANGVKIYGATLTPFEGTFAGYYTPEKDEIRIEVNDWIRGSGEFDGVVDFEAAVQDPDKPRVMKEEYNSGDNLHPGDAGYKAMADYIDLSMFR